MWELFDKQLKGKFLFLMAKIVLFNALFLLIFSHFITFLFFEHLQKFQLTQAETYVLISVVLLIYIVNFVFTNKTFYKQYQFLRINIAEKELASHGILTAQFIKPVNAICVEGYGLGNIQSKAKMKGIDLCINAAVQNGRILIDRNKNLEARFIIFEENKPFVQVAEFNLKAINELSHQDNRHDLVDHEDIK